MTKQGDSPQGQPLPLIAIVGPTAAGKTAASIRIASAIAAEIINADSRSFYRGMDIGTAKPSAADRATVPHHLIDLLEPTDPMSLATFQDLVYQLIADIHARGNVPLLVGGTPQYVNAVMEGWEIPRVAPNEEFRLKLEREAERDGVAAIQARLHAVDPDAAEKSGGNLRRLIRALEVYDATGIPITRLQTKRALPYRTREYELGAPREVLYQRIDDRVDAQIELGLIEEVKRLLDLGVPETAPSFSSIGYRQVLPYIHGETSLAEVRERIKLDSHRLVRQQQTWFRKNPRLVPIDTTDPGWMDRLGRDVRDFLQCRPS
jgi:tRNA dimethylallyltransferase